MAIDPRDMSRMLRERVQESLDSLTGEPDSRLTVRVRFCIQFGDSVIDHDRCVPLGDTTDETLRHIRAIIVDPGMILARDLIAAHFQALQYLIDQEDSTP
jgi:hypothetical protein